MMEMLSQTNSTLFFVNVGTVLAKSIPPTVKTPVDYIQQDILSSYFKEKYEALFNWEKRVYLKILFTHCLPLMYECASVNFAGVGSCNDLLSNWLQGIVQISADLFPIGPYCQWVITCVDCTDKHVVYYPVLCVCCDYFTLWSLASSLFIGVEQSLWCRPCSRWLRWRFSAWWPLVQLEHSGRSPKVVAPFLLQTLVAIWYDIFNCMIQSKSNQIIQESTIIIIIQP